MGRRDIIVIGASAGGVEALKELAARLPRELEAAILVVLHIAPSSFSVLPAILERAGALAARHATDGEALVRGTIYCAPPDHHLLIHNERIRLSRGPRVNGHRPAIDPLFSSSARWCSNRVISVVLSGVLDDGTVGTSAVARGGGVTLAQDPASALYPPMPHSAIEIGGASIVADVPGLAAHIVRLTQEEIPGAQTGGPMRPDMEEELELDEEASAAMQGPASSFTCPDCHGALWEIKDAGVPRYRCRIGHSYSSETLFAEQSEKIEEALWAGYRALEESAALAERLAKMAEARGSHAIAERYRTRHRDAVERAKTLRAALEAGQLYSAEQNE